MILLSLFGATYFTACEIGEPTQRSGKISYLDDTYLRIASREDELDGNIKQVRICTYDGKKLVRDETRVQGEDNGYNNALLILAEYEYDGLKCTGTITQYNINSEINGVVSAVSNVEIEYLK